MRFSQCAWFRLIVFIASVLLFTGSSFAQNPSATVRGEITDPLGAVIPGATISARNATGQTVTVKTNRSGAYELRGLAPGKYTVAVNAKGFAEATKDVEITTGKDQKLDMRLQIAVEQQNVVVDEDKPKVDLGPENNAGATVLKGKDLEALSDDPDELQSDLQALAGPAAGPNGGQMYIDGFSGGTLPPKASIREIRINQNPFSAQYDHLGYGRIEIFTKPGTDKFHGQLMFRENTSALNARNPFGGTHQPDYQTHQFEGNIGGPIGKKASFFFNAERRNIDESSIVNAFTSLDANNKPVTFSHAVPNPRVNIEVTPRFDYQVTANNTLTTRVEYNRGHSINNGVGGFSLPEQAYNQHYSEWHLQVSDTQILNSKTVNETRFQYVHALDSQKALTSLPQISVLGAFTGGGNSIGVYSTTQNSYELQNYTSMALGNHFVRFGGRLHPGEETDRIAQNFNGTFTFSSLDAYLKTLQGLGPGPTQFSISAGNPITSNTSVDAGLYAEDDWKARPDLMISYGLRYETQNNIHDHADFAPRLGVAWAPGGKKNTAPKTVFRAGFGVFYDRFGQNLVLQAERLNGVNQQQFIVPPTKDSPPPNFFPNVPPINTLSLQSVAIRQIDTRLRAPYTMQSAATMERQLTKTANISVTYLHSRGVHQLLSRNINAPQLDGSRPYGPVGNIYQFQSEGIFEQNQLITNFNVRGKIVSLFGFYMLNYANGNTSGASSFPVNQYDLAAEYGRLSYDIRHRLFFGGSVNIPYGFRLNPAIIFNSGQPFNITVGKDLNGDSLLNDRPSFATSSSDPKNVMVTRWGTFDLNPTLGERIIPLNLGTGPARVTLNLRLSKTIGLGGKPNSAQTSGGGPGGGGPRMGGGEGRGGGEGMGRIFGGGGGGGNSEQRYNLTLSIGARNAFNHMNLANPIGNLSSPRFGQSNGLAGGPFNSSAANRSVDLQMNFSF